MSTQSDPFFDDAGGTQDEANGSAAPEVAVEQEPLPAAPAAPAEAPVVASVPDEVEDAEKPFGYVRHKHFGIQAGPADHPRTRK